MPVSRKQPAAPEKGRATATAEEGPSFEEALERLETIVEELEAGSLSLEQSLARYEEGMRLSRRLTQTLDQAEKRIERLVEDEGEGGVPTTRPFEQLAGEREAGEPPAGERPPGKGASARGDRATDGGEGELPF
jgi:exodeoxyribonuclease VII small subunit